METNFWKEDVEGRGELNRINDGTSMILPTRFGDLTDPNVGKVQGTLTAIRSKGRLDCGGVVPNDLNVSLVDAKGAIDVSVSGHIQGRVMWLRHSTMAQSTL